VAKLDEELPVELRTVRTRPLFVMQLDVKGPLVVGETSNGFRRIGIVPGGSFEGERLSGQVLDGGSDWQVVRGDDSTTLDVRLVLRTDDDVLVTMFYRGIRHGPREIIERIERGEVVGRPPITSASIRCSRPPRGNTTGSTASSRSGSATGGRMDRSIACSKCCSGKTATLGPHLLRDGIGAAPC
jgi:hypothetical protein